MHTMEVTFFLHVNGVKLDQFKATISEMNSYSLCLGNISKDFAFNNMKKIHVIKCKIF